MSAPTVTEALAGLPPLPSVDFALFGEVESKPVTRIKRFTAAFLTRNWVTIPHVTHHDEADVTALEALRRRHAAAQPEAKITALPFLMKAVIKSLAQYPQFNASLDATGANLVFKKYFHVGIAVDTPRGLLVPVIRNVDRKSIAELSAELAAVSRKAREKGLSMDEMSGGCFSISSLGGIGGTAFTPIINAPEVAILGVCRSFQKPLPSRDDPQRIDWRTMLPLSLSYDHRVIDGAEAARFCASLAASLAEPESLA
ncbi:MAG: hypothetical protein JWQ90_431 [Hydrocarboniphaga sp.]|uniref:2-oxo acid dehydrogenase subunit E2 n=1 Tax=Hydrocarboniphaga sp. TaxID=2033016 RepID=UPI00260D96FB|nr:2-oxo acid dehydrogenase subunit E2 [Hydrocarboniphaga sp.]MDB5967981.1 hypothetical protein [Hydrocarboniphaga sp.]